MTNFKFSYLTVNNKIFILLIVAVYLTPCDTFTKTDNRSAYPVEPEDPKIDNTSWDSMSEEELKASFVSIDKKYAKSVNSNITSHLCLVKNIR